MIDWRFRSETEREVIRFLDENEVAWIYEPLTLASGKGPKPGSRGTIRRTPDLWLPFWETFVEIKSSVEQMMDQQHWLWVADWLYKHESGIGFWLIRPSKGRLEGIEVIPSSQGRPDQLIDFSLGERSYVAPDLGALGWRDWVERVIVHEPTLSGSMVQSLVAHAKL